MAGTPGRMDIKYTAEATSSGDARNGHVRSSDGIIDQDMAMPKEMGGPGGATNPEQLFAAGYAACFHQALKLAAGQEKRRRRLLERRRAGRASARTPRASGSRCG